EDGIRALHVTGVQTCALPISLLEREESGQGQWVHASLLHSQIAMMDFQAARYLNDGDIPVQVGNDHPTSSPMGLFDAIDGQFNRSEERRVGKDSGPRGLTAWS